MAHKENFAMNTQLSMTIDVAWVKILRGPNSDAARILVQGISNKKIFIKILKIQYKICTKI